MATLSEFFRLASLFALYLAAFIIIKNRQDFSQLIRIIILSLFIPAGLSFYQFITATGISLPFEGVYNRIFGTFAHPNLLAFYTLVPLTLSCGVYLISSKNKVKDYPYLIVAGVFLLLLGLTFTRGAWLAFAFTIFIIGLIKYRKFLLVFLGFCLVAYILISPIQTRIDDLAQPGPDSSISWRLNLWHDCLRYFNWSPHFGYGLGTANNIILDHRGYQAGSSDPHNDYLRLALELGWPGLLAYLWLIFSLLKNLYRKYKTANQPKIKNLILIILALTLSLYIASLADNILRNTALQWTFWILIAGIFKTSSKNKKPC